MKYLLSSFFVLLLFTHNASAGNLCDESCDFVITFPDGGSIDATEALTIIFGDGGFVNDGIVTTGYAMGETVLLAAGESLSFGSDGVLTLGMGGNIDYTDMIFNSSGNSSLTAIGGTESILIETLTLGGGLNITFNGDVINISGTLYINGGVLNITGDYVGGTVSSSPSVCSTQSSAGTLTLSSSTPIVTTGTCSNLSSTFNLPINEFTIVSIDPNITLSATGTISLTPVNVGVTSLQPLTQEFLSSLPDGIDFPTDDGNTCTLTAGECITLGGQKYIVADGKLVPEELGDSGSSSNGAMGWFLYLIAFCLVGCRKQRAA